MDFAGKRSLPLRQGRPDGSALWTPASLSGKRLDLNPLPCAYLCGFLYPLPHCIIIKKWLPQLNTAAAHFYALIQSSYHLSFLSLIYFLSRKKGSAVTLMSDRHSSTSHLQGESTPARIQKTNATPGNPDTCFPLLRLCIGAIILITNKTIDKKSSHNPYTQDYARFFV